VLKEKPKLGRRVVPSESYEYQNAIRNEKSGVVWTLILEKSPTEKSVISGIWKKPKMTKLRLLKQCGGKERSHGGGGKGLEVSFLVEKGQDNHEARGGGEMGGEKIQTLNDKCEGEGIKSFKGGGADREVCFTLPAKGYEEK